MSPSGLSPLVPALYRDGAVGPLLDLHRDAYPALSPAEVCRTFNAAARRALAEGVDMLFGPCGPLPVWGTLSKNG